MSIPTLSESIHERKLSYLKATLFLIEQEQIDNDRLKIWAQQQIRETEKETPTLSTAKKASEHFDEFFKLLILEIAKALDLSSDEAHKQLKEIEMLYVWSQERQAVISDPISITHSSDTSKTLQVTQHDIPIAHTTQQQKIELLKIFLTQPPEWFKGLSKLTQKYLQNTLKPVVDAIAQFTQLANKQGAALVDEYLKIFDSTQPDWFKQLSPEDQNKMITPLDQIDKIIHTTPCYLRTVPLLANYGQHVTEIKMGDDTTVKTQRYRHSVVVPHDVKTPKKSDTKSEQLRLTKQNIIQLFGEKQGDKTSPLYQVAERFITQWKIQPNTKDQLIEIPVLMQTFLSPTLFLKAERQSMEILPRAIRDLQEDGVLPTYTLEIGGKTYYIKPKLTNSNYPLNAARLLLAAVPDSETRKRNLRNATQLLRNAGKFLQKVVQPQINIQNFINALNSYHILKFQFTNTNCVDLKQAIDNTALTPAQKLDLKILIDAIHDYVDLYQSTSEKMFLPTSALLIFASLEEIITERNGGLMTGSCKSAKDRKGIETVHTDAMLAYYLLYDKFPQSNENTTTPEGKNFETIYAALFNTEQQHRWAATNAPGSQGFEHLQVEPTWFQQIKPKRFISLSPLPSDLLDAIFKDDPKKLKQSDLLGRLFRPKNPLKQKEMEDLTPLSQFIFPKPVISTISKAVAERDDEKPTTPTQAISLPLPKETEQKNLTAIYFPEGSDPNYPMNTLKLSGGRVSDHFNNAAFCAIEYFKRNPDLDAFIELNGHPKVVEAFQWIFVAALGVPLSYIKIPDKPGFQLIQIKEKDNLIDVPSQFIPVVNKAKELIKERKKQLTTIRVQAGA